MKKFAVVLVMSLAVLMGGCTADPVTPGDAAEPVGLAFVERIDAATEAVVITEDNDPNRMIGRMNGYVGGVVIKDRRASCDRDDRAEETLGRACGAFIEIWRDAKTAERRASYLRSIMGFFGAGEEYHAIRGNVLLRVSASLGESEAQEYFNAFELEVQQ